MRRVRAAFRVRGILAAALLVALTTHCQKPDDEDFSTKSFEELIELTGAGEFLVRERATTELIQRVRARSATVPQLVPFLSSPDPEVKFRIEAILARFGRRQLIQLVTLWNVLERIKTALQQVPLPTQQELEALAKRLEDAGDELKRSVENRDLDIPDSNKDDVRALDLDLRIRADSLRKLRGGPDPAAAARLLGNSVDRFQQRTKEALDRLPDQDGDGMPPSWELKFGLDPGRDDGGEDPDEDGASNAEEFKRGTDPRVRD
jgi:hypothetical protein